MSDHEVRLAAFAFLDQQVAIHGEVLPWCQVGMNWNVDTEHVL